MGEGVRTLVRVAKEPPSLFSFTANSVGLEMCLL
jgi:hypothetical protein